MPTRIVRRASACVVRYERLVALAIAVQSAGTSVEAGPVESQRNHFTLFTSEMFSRLATSVSPTWPTAAIWGASTGGNKR